MKLTPISAGHFHGDGGAIFGVIPKVLWSKLYPANEDNFARLALRCLLVESGNRKILIETGIGNHYSEKHLNNHGVSSVTQLTDSLAEKGIPASDITDVFFTHLHWDHCTGAVRSVENGFELAFPKAVYWCSRKHWEHARVSNAREQAALNRPVLDFLLESGKLQLAEQEGELFPGFTVRFFDGHTPGQMIPFIRFGERTLVYTADLIPTFAHIPLLWIAAYDLAPVQVMKEKQAFLEEAAKKNYILFFEHDYYHECATVQQTEKGVVLKETFNLAELTGDPR